MGGCSNAIDILNLFVMIFPGMSFHFKLVPVRDRGYEYGQLSDVEPRSKL